MNGSLRFSPPARFRNTGILIVLLGFAGLLPGVSQARPVASDPGFSAVLEQSGQVTALSAYTNGSLLVAGRFHRVGPLHRQGLVLLDRSGVPVPAFDARLGGDVWVQSVLAQADGRILLAGTFSLPGQPFGQTVVRLHPDGTRDATFQLQFPEQPEVNLGPTTLALDPRGRVYLAAYGLDAGLYAIRLDAGGVAEPERVFRGHAWVRFSRQRGPGIHVLGDGRIYLSGEFEDFSTDYWHQNPGPWWSADGLVRLRDDGQVDPGFVLYPGFTGSVFTTALTSDGRIVAGGNFTQLHLFPRPGIAVVKPDGAIDLDFRPRDIASGTVTALVPMEDGRIVAGGRFQLKGDLTPRSIVGFLPDGRIDPGFSPVPAGLVGGTGIEAIVRMEDQRLVAGGSEIGAEANGAGALRTIGKDGTPATDSMPTVFQPGLANRIESLPGGRLFIAGWFNHVNSTRRDGLARLQRDGAVDAGFVVPGTHWSVSSLVSEPDGSMVLGGWFPATSWGQVSLLKLAPNGGFAPDFTPPRLPDGAGVQGVLRRSDGDLLLAGNFWVSTPTNTWSRGLIQLAPDGTERTNVFEVSSASDLLALPGELEGGLLVVQDAWGTSPIVRLDSNGWRDPAFSLRLQSGGAAGLDGTVASLARDTQGRVLIGGYFSHVGTNAVPGLLRIRPDGEVDTTFVPGIIAGWVEELRVDATGRVLVMGRLVLAPGQPQGVGCVRLLPDGGLDPSFPPIDPPVFGLALDGEAVWVSRIDYSDPMVPVGRIERYAEVFPPSIHWTWSSGSRDLALKAMNVVPGSLRWERSVDLKIWLPVSGAGTGAEWTLPVPDGIGAAFFRVVRPL